MKNMWNKRYAEKEFAYGEEPNLFFRDSLNKLPVKPGKILMPADGEGRNGVFAAEQGWDVLSFDFSEEARNKAIQLANRKGVEIQFELGSFEEIRDKIGSMDVVGLVFAHFSPDIRTDYHKGFQDLLSPGGYVILEGFSTDHIEYQKKNPHVGGPKEVSLLFSERTIKEDFSECKVLHLESCEASLQEGKYHQGVGHVIRFVGQKRMD
jgi:cyclopropane fatty-acyl-phospholipid synthase-like methyltransferase